MSEGRPGTVIYHNNVNLPLTADDSLRAHRCPRRHGGSSRVGMQMTLPATFDHSELDLTPFDSQVAGGSERQSEPMRVVLPSEPQAFAYGASGSSCMSCWRTGRTAV